MGEQDFGHIYEIVLDPNDPMTAIDVKDHPQVGRLRHEGIEVGSDGSVYVIDELNAELSRAARAYVHVFDTERAARAALAVFRR